MSTSSNQRSSESTLPWRKVVDDWRSNKLIQDPARAIANLENMVRRRLPVELFGVMVRQIGNVLPQISDPDMALNNLEQFFAAVRSPLSLVSLFERDESAIPILLKIFSTSQYLSDLLIRDPAAYDALRLTAGQPVSREVLIDEITSLLEIIDAEDRDQAMRMLRRFKHREVLRIAFGDIVAQQTLETVTDQISYVADAVCEAAIAFVQRSVAVKYGKPVDANNNAIGMTVVAMGKLGGNELNYSSDIDLVMLYSADGKTTGAHHIDASEYFERVARGFASLLNDQTPNGVAYRVDYRLRPNGSTGPLACSIDKALAYYDVRGRTWERQALVKARCVAGDISSGQHFLAKLQPWIYATRLSMTDINGIRALKRQIERRTLIDGDDETNVKTGRGGIRDIEFVTQFLQLLHGGTLPEVRSGNTLDGLRRLYGSSCLNDREYALLDQGYRWLRRLEHRLQIMFDLQTHSLPVDPNELRKVAIRTGLPGDARVPTEPNESGSEQILTRFRDQLKKTTGHNRGILDHLLHDAFAGGEDGDGSEEADLVLDPDPAEPWIVQVMSRHGFQNPKQAYQHLMHLATEESRFLSPHRCRHFLAAIADRLLFEISVTPDPDMTLNRLSAVSASLGGKAVLWELFSSNASTMKLYVRLGAACDYLCDLLVRNPGMVDGLMDSLILQHLPSFEFLSDSLAELARGAEDFEPIVHSFRDVQHLRVGTRDILGQDEVANTHRALADIAEVCLANIADREKTALQERHGIPRLADSAESEMLILALGKMGGREPNYHSDLDLVFVYTSEGAAMTSGGRDPTNHQDFFSRLAANISRRVSHTGRWGKLYEVDCRLRPTGKSGPLAVSATELTRYFVSGQGQLWERLALCKARSICGSDSANRFARSLITSLITSHPWESGNAAEVADMRQRMEQGATPRNIKRGKGGTVDIEFAIQMLQLKFARRFPEILVPNTIEAARALNARSCLSDSDLEFLTRSYQMLRWVEARLRLMNSASRHDLPTEPGSLARLAYLLDYPRADELLREIELLREENRRRFLRLVESSSRP